MDFSGGPLGEEPTDLKMNTLVVVVVDLGVLGRPYRQQPVLSWFWASDKFWRTQDIAQGLSSMWLWSLAVPSQPWAEKGPERPIAARASAREQKAGRGRGRARRQAAAEKGWLRGRGLDGRRGELTRERRGREGKAQHDDRPRWEEEGKGGGGCGRSTAGAERREFFFN